jgi:hypothetical protein
VVKTWFQAFAFSNATCTATPRVKATATAMAQDGTVRAVQVELRFTHSLKATGRLVSNPFLPLNINPGCKNVPFKCNLHHYSAGVDVAVVVVSSTQGKSLTGKDRVGYHFSPRYFAVQTFVGHVSPRCFAVKNGSADDSQYDGPCNRC